MVDGRLRLGRDARRTSSSGSRQTREVCEGIGEIAITVNAGGAPHWMAIKNQELFASQVMPRLPGRPRSRGRAGLSVIERVCVIGAGVIGSLFAGHLAEVAEVSVLTRRREHADALNAEGLRVTGRSDRQARVTATEDPAELEPFDLGIVATKASGLEAAAESLEGRFPEATIMPMLNGLGAEEVVRAHGDWPIVSAVTFISGTKHSDTRGRVHPRHGDLARAVRGHAVRGRARRSAELIARRPEGRGAARPAAGAVVEADLQRDGELGRSADRAPARRPLRRGGGADRSRASRPRPRRRGEGGRRPRPGSSSTTTRGR